MHILLCKFAAINFMLTGASVIRMKKVD